MSIMVDTRLPDDVAPDVGFDVSQTVWNLGGILLVQQAAPAYRFERTQEKVQFSPVDHWTITFLRKGNTWTGVDGRVAMNTPGTLEIRSLGTPFRGRALATEAVSVIVPVDEFADYGGLPSTSNNAIIGGLRAELLINYLASLEVNLDHIASEDLPSVKDRLREMVFETVAPLVAHGRDDDRTRQIGLMARARRIIQNNLTSAELTPDTLSRELGISRTRLYELFANSGGVANYIRRRRLSTIHAILFDPTNSQRIAEVAYAFGFDSTANFSRAFTQQFGYSPSNVRKQMRTGRADAESAVKIENTFEKLLVMLGNS